MLLLTCFSRGLSAALALTAAIALTGCASIRNAQPKTVEVDGQR
jgi:hypothetical protein